MENEICYWLFCFVPLNPTDAKEIFGFTEYLAFVALFAVIYTVTDIRFKFRIAIVPRLYLETLILVTIIGLLTLVSEVWSAQGWWVPKTAQWFTMAIWQGILGLLLLATIVTWIYYAFICPPTFNKSNFRHFAQELYRHISQGVEEELKIIANELARSAPALIRYSRRLFSRGNEQEKKNTIEDYAHDMLLLIATRKFCRQIVTVSPITAQAFFKEMHKPSNFDVPFGHFARNISSEAIAQKNSFLYEEDEGYSVGLLGYLKTVSRTMFGNSRLIEILAARNSSPLDISFTEYRSWDAVQWNAYSRIIIIAFEDYLNRGAAQDTVAINRAIGIFEHSYSDCYKLNDIPEAFNTDIYGRLSVAVEFVKKIIEMINNQPNRPAPLHRIREGTYPKNIYDHLAMSIFDICFAASTVKSPTETCWMIHHNLVWNAFFSRIGGDGIAWRIIRQKVRRLLYDEIAQLEKFPNYKRAKILGYCLNVLGTKMGPNIKKDDDCYVLGKVVQSWAQKHYFSMWTNNHDVAESVLIGSLSFDQQNKWLVKTYAKGLAQEAPKTILELQD